VTHPPAPDFDPLALFAADRVPHPDFLLTTRVTACPPAPGHDKAQDIAAKLHHLTGEFAGQPCLGYYHAGLIVHIRRSLRLPEMLARFESLWAAQADALLAGLSSRWLVSACDTIADHAADPQERAAATAASACLTTLRLYETERRERGTDARPLMAPGPHTALFDGLIHFAIGAGDGIVNLWNRVRAAESAGTRVGRILATLLARAEAADTVFPRMARLHHDHRTAWRDPPPPVRRIALVNDPSALGHYGHDAVADTLDRLFADTGLQVVHRHPAGQPWPDDPAARAALAACDAVVVVGAGDVAVARAAAAAGRPAYLVNATLQAAGPDELRDLRTFRHIWVRDGASQRRAAGQGLAVSLCPDLSLCQTFPIRKPADPGSAAVFDANPGTGNRDLLRMARRLDVPLWTMRHDAEGRPLVADRQARGSDDVTLSPQGRPRPLPRFAAMLSARERIIAGRFHAQCFALVLGIPFHALAPDATAAGALVQDAGLNPDRLLPPGARLPPHLPLSQAERAAIGRYLRLARFAASEMVLRIRELS
jgi:hypothetical protein